MKINDFTNHFPGCVSCLPAETLSKLLAEDRPLRIKLGFDPTASELHLGHSVLLNALKKFQDIGHQVVVVIGDFTACIGDPTLRDVTRPPLSHEDVLLYAEGYQQQLYKFLDPNLTEIRCNGDWLNDITLRDWIGIMGQVTLSQMIERDDFRKRMHEQLPISGHEIMYPLLQGYDSVAVHADIELGGTDQTFNLMMGRVLQKIFGQSPQVVMTFPLLEGLDGVKKMSKSYKNTINLDENPQDMYGKVMSVSDALMWQYYKLLTPLSAIEIEHKKTLHPMLAKHDLAVAITSLYHGMENACKEKDFFIERFSQRNVPSDNIPCRVLTLAQEQLPVHQLLRELELVESASLGLRLIQQGAVKLDDQRIQDISPLLLTGTHVLKVGKRKIITIQKA